MNFYFCDEFKMDRGETLLYGLVLVRINSVSYGRFKKGFYSKLKELGWNESIEIKGRYSFSSNKGDVHIPIEERLTFVEELFELSKTGSGSYAATDVYFTFRYFERGTIETDMYEKLVIKLIKTLPKGLSSGNKNGKNNSVFCLDNNKSLDIIRLNRRIETALEERNLSLVEKCYFVVSDNRTPGILFADHVAYFIQNFIKTSSFNDATEKQFKSLLTKYQEGLSLNSNEKSILRNCLISIKKEEQSRKLIKTLKKMKIVK